MIASSGPEIDSDIFCQNQPVLIFRRGRFHKAFLDAAQKATPSLAAALAY
jgi:hypothetical protein